MGGFISERSSWLVWYLRYLFVMLAGVLGVFAADSVSFCTKLQLGQTGTPAHLFAAQETLAEAQLRACLEWRHGYAIGFAAGFALLASATSGVRGLLLAIEARDRRGVTQVDGDW